MEQTAFDEALKYIIGFIGGVLSLQFVSEDRSKWDKILMALTGTFVAGFGTPAVISLLSLSPEYSNALAFVLGMYGWALTGGVMRVIRHTDWSAIIERKVGK